MTSTIHPLALLALPEHTRLSPTQLAAMACVWCEKDLGSATAVDLGERTLRTVSWSPRACRPCALQKAMLALTEHVGACGQCVADHTKCPTGVGLVRAVRGARR